MWSREWDEIRQVEISNEVEQRRAEIDLSCEMNQRIRAPRFNDIAVVKSEKKINALSPKREADTPLRGSTHIQMRLLNDTETNTHVDLPSGKITKTGNRKRIRKQKGMGCTLYALRRISIFNTTDKNDKHLKAYKNMKHMLANYMGDYEEMVFILKLIFEEVGINLQEAISNNKNFNEKLYKYKKSTSSINELFELMDSSVQWKILYEIFIMHVLKPLLSLKNADWHPRDGFKGLQKNLKNNGALFFMGKFGMWCYSTDPVESKSETTEKRHVFYFNKQSYQGDSIPFTHGIIVDQAKIVNGKQMIFYRDPYFRSRESSAEKIFMLSFDTFVKRLTDLQGDRFIHHLDSVDATYGLASSNPVKLYGHQKNI